MIDYNVSNCELWIFTSQFITIQNGQSPHLTARWQLADILNMFVSYFGGATPNLTCNYGNSATPNLVGSFRAGIPFLQPPKTSSPGRPFLWVQSLLKLASTKPPCPTLSTISKLLSIASLQKKSMFLGGGEGWLFVVGSHYGIKDPQGMQRWKWFFLRVLGWAPWHIGGLCHDEIHPKACSRSSQELYLFHHTWNSLVKDSIDKKSRISYIDTSYMTLKKYVCRICIICFKNIYISSSELVWSWILINTLSKSHQPQR